MTLSDMTKDAIAIVTARGGSKRIPGKNIRDFHGKPLLSWTIHNLFSSHLFSRVIVSTDSKEISAVSTEAGADVPFLRPPELSDDLTPTANVADHAINWLIGDGVADNTKFCVVYPAAVSVTPKDLADSREMLESSSADLVFAGCEFSSHPDRAWALTEGNLVTPLRQELQSVRSQDLEPRFYDAGQFYWSNKTAWADLIQGRPIRRALYIMPRSRAIDIDTEEDWELAEFLFPLSWKLT